MGKLLVDANGVKERPVILVEGERIVKVGLRGSLVMPSDAEVIDASDLVLMPGLIDCHVHFSGSKEGGIFKFREPFETRLIRAAVKEARQLLEAGFTSVMDAGGQVGLHVRNAIREGIVPGPRVMAAGRHISVTGGHGDTPYLPLEWVKEGRPMGWGMEGRIADGVDECIRAVRENLRLGVDFIKICTSGGGGDNPEIPEYTLEEIRAMTHIAHSWRRRVMVHCYNPEGIRRSVLGGVDIISHCNLADEASIGLMREHGTIVVPTMSIYYAMAQRRRVEAEARPRVSRLAETLFDDIRRLYDGGLVLAMGTDTMGIPLAFGKNALELELYVKEVGLTPLEAIKIGTLNGAIAMGRRDLGTLEEGKLADIIAVEVNPLEDVKSLQEEDNVRLVMKGGEVYKDNL
ncbi:amidohydrolase family protein [Candidatus Bathyarchaeota archaeon]|nr:amidohydrolase family protein [Candidatus Bathyarchaeota archaeon]